MCGSVLCRSSGYWPRWTRSSTRTFSLLAERGFVASDFYDGCIIYDFQTSRTYLCDLDEYREGPFVLDMDRAYGATRFMAPEEFQRGAVIDQVTNVFNLGRAATVLLGDGTESMDAWKGTELMRKVVERATLPTERFATNRWRSSLMSGGRPQ